jgi:hypothetical protein
MKPTTTYKRSNGDEINFYTNIYGQLTTTAPTEEFVDIKDYEGLYAVTNFGDVYSYKSNRFLKPQDNGKGYLQVTLTKGNVKIKYYVHRLVAETFIPRFNIDGIVWTVDHINKIRYDNRVNNLQWVTNYDNIKLMHERNKITIEDVNRLIKQTTLFNDTPEEKDGYMQDSQSIYNYYLREIDRIASKIAIAHLQKRYDDSFALQDSLLKSIEKEPFISDRQYYKFLNILKLEVQLFENKLKESWEK